MNPLLALTWQGSRLCNDDGLRGWIAEQIGPRPVQCPILSADRFVDDTWVDVALTWCGDRQPPQLFTFVNTCRSRAGTHIRGFWEGIGAGARRRSSVTRRRFAPGLVAVLHVGIFDPVFDAPVRDNLRSPSARRAVRSVVGEIVRKAPVEWMAHRLHARHVWRAEP